MAVITIISITTADLNVDGSISCAAAAAAAAAVAADIALIIITAIILVVLNTIDICFMHNLYRFTINIDDPTLPAVFHLSPRTHRQTLLQHKHNVQQHHSHATHGSVRGNNWRQKPANGRTNQNPHGKGRQNQPKARRSVSWRELVSHVR